MSRISNFIPWSKIRKKGYNKVRVKPQKGGQMQKNSKEKLEMAKTILSILYYLLKILLLF